MLNVEEKDIKYATEMLMNGRGRIKFTNCLKETDLGYFKGMDILLKMIAKFSADHDSRDFLQEYRLMFNALLFPISTVYSALDKHLPPGDFSKEISDIFKEKDSDPDILRKENILLMKGVNKGWGAIYDYFLDDIQQKLGSFPFFGAMVLVNIFLVQVIKVDQGQIQSSEIRVEGEKILPTLTHEINFNQIGGQTRAKKEIMSLATALKDPEKYYHWGTKPPRGICLYGPPGTGKTLLAKALALETKVPFYNIPSSQLISMWYGESEKNIDTAFAKARKTGGVIFFDEADALAPSRSDDIHEATKRNVAALNRNMDGFNQSDRVVVFLATNRVQDMDEAILRAGRIDRLIEVPLPDVDGRREIFQIHILNAEKLAKRKLFKNINLGLLINLTEGLSGADIAEIVRRTLETKVQKEFINEKVGMVTTKDIRFELGQYERFKKEVTKIGFSETLKV